MDNCIVKNIDELLSIIDNNFDDFKSVLDQVVADVVKNPQHINAFITYISVQLSNSKSRCKGIFLLDIFLTVAPSENVTDNAVAWLNNCLKYPARETQIDDNTFRVIKLLLELCYGIPELNKAVTSGTFSNVIEHITRNNYESTNCINALKCLETCIRVYSGPCTTFKNNLEKYLIGFVDSSKSKTIVRAAAKCLHALQQVGQGGAQGVLHKQYWKKHQLNLCTSIHSLMDEIFESITEFGNFQQENSSPLQLPDLPNGDPIQLNANRINNLVIFLQEMLLGAFPTAKSVLPNTILDVISRGLSVTNSTIGNQIFNDALNLGSNLYFIHKHLLELLQSLIICLGCNLIPYSTVIVKLLVNNLKCTSPKTADNVNVFCDLRLTTYQTLSVWSNTCKSASCLSIFAGELIPIIMTDITPIKSELKLTVQSNTPKNLSKKARKKLQQDQISQSSVAKTYSPIIKKPVESTNICQAKICSEALRLLQCLLINNGYLLEPLVHKHLQEFTVKTLFDIQRGLTINPYDDTQCKIELYKTLSNLVANHHWDIPPPLDYAILLLSKGQVENDPQIAAVCSTALSNINTVIHPAFATLQLPIDLDLLKEQLNLETKTNPVLLFNNDTITSDNEIELFDNSTKVISTPENGETEENLPSLEVSTSKETEIEDINTFKAVEKEIEKIEEKAKKQKEKIKNALVEVFETIKENHKPQLAENDTSKLAKTDDVIEISGGTTPPIQAKVEKNRSPNKSYSVQIEILSDDEVMERLTIDDDSEINQVKSGSKREAEPDTNGVEPSKKKCTETKEKDGIIDLVEEDMCSAFVDIVNQ